MVSAEAIRRALAVGAWYAIGLVVAATPILTDLTVPPGPDVSWLLLVGERLLDGARFGRDVIEVNPPLIAWLNVPVVALAKSLGFSAAAVYQFLVSVLAGLTAAWCVRLLPPSHPMARTPGPAFAAACFILAWLPTSSFGQREHLAVMLTAPWFMVGARRMESAAVGNGEAAVLGLMAGVGFALKPFFVLPFALVEAALWRHRSAPRPLNRPESLVVAGFLLSYPLIVLAITPEYLNVVLEFWPVYQDYFPMTLGGSITMGGSSPWVGFAAMALAVPAWRQWRGGLELVLSLAVVGFFGASLIQLRAWPYVWLPVLLFGWSLLGLLLVRSSQLADTRNSRHMRAGVVLIVACLMVAYTLRGGMVAWAKLGWASSETSAYQEIRAVVARCAEGQPVAALSPSHGGVFPAVIDGGGRWSLRFNSLWPVAAVIPGVGEPGPIIRSLEADPRSPAMTALRMTAEDLLATPPALLIVPILDSTIRHRSGYGRIDFISILSADSTVGTLLTTYGEIARSGAFRVLRRDPRGAASGAICALRTPRDAESGRISPRKSPF